MEWNKVIGLEWTLVFRIPFFKILLLTKIKKIKNKNKMSKWNIKILVCKVKEI